LPDIRSTHYQEHRQAVAMDLVSFSIVDPGTGPEIRIEVNGRPLQHLARDVEQIHAKAESNLGLAGDYAGLSPLQIHGTARHFLGEPEAAWFEDGDTVLMGCTCGEWGCWPLTAVVLAADDVVRWTNFRTGHRDWDLSGLGPFEFERSQYETALSSMRLTL